MKFYNPIMGKFLKRYKRFFVDYEVDGDIYTAHCINTGKMSNLLLPHHDIILSQYPNPKKLTHKWEAICTDKGLIGTNTMNPNKLFEEYLLNINATNIKREVTIGKKRIDFTFTYKDRYIIAEVKNIHWMPEGTKVLFPDCITTRGTQQQRELAKVIEGGQEVWLVFIAQRNDCDGVGIAKHIDNDFYEAVSLNINNGMKVFGLNCNVTHKEITVNREISFF